jgi:hypothetical protein
MKEPEGDEDVYGDVNKKSTSKNKIVKSAPSVQSAPVTPVASAETGHQTTDFEHAKTEAIFIDEIEDIAGIQDVQVKNINTDDLLEKKHFAEPKISAPKPIPPSIDNNDSKTYAVWEDEEGMSPVCGWIVGLKGSYKGRSFEVKSGNNYIGRDSDMDISLPGEPTVSRKRHTVITYDRIGNKFYMQQGESSGTAYINEKIVFAATELKSGDKIIIGDAEFMFATFCNDKFTWEEII